MEALAVWNIEEHWTVVVALLAFAGFVFWGWFSASHKLKQYEDRRPTVIVEPEIEGKFFRLKITNTGYYKTEFGIEISGWQGLDLTEPPMQSSYEGKWRGEGSPISVILPKQTKEIDVVQNEGFHVDDQRSVKDKIQRLIISDHHNTQWVCKVRLNSTLKFSVKVIASPDLKTPFEKTYSLTVGDGTWTQIQELNE